MAVLRRPVPGTVDATGAFLLGLLPSIARAVNVLRSFLPATVGRQRGMSG